ncbi:MAG TPA: hypothetical protein VLA74_09705 [Nitrososphaeraceae archaeon]|nr:hypothetical protein [Nitrososphaeraceae archaeon]
MLLVALAGMMLFTTTASADVEDYIKAMCEQHDGKWSDKNMACNDFESETEQWNFGDALMTREEYDEITGQCEEKDGEWSDEKVKCTISDPVERTAFEDAICDDGPTKICQLSNRN